MPDMNIDTAKLERYAELKTLIKEAEKELKPLNEWIANEMESSKLDELNTNFGKFYFTTRSKCKYPEEIVTEEETLKAHKKEAEQKGYAERDEQKILTYKKEVEDAIIE